MGTWIVLGIIGIVALICLWGCSYFVWRLYLLRNSEYGTAELAEIIKGRRYYNPFQWEYEAYVRITFQGETFKEKMKFSVRERLHFAPGYEIPVTVSRDKHGKVRVFQETDKVFLAVLAGECGFGVIMMGTVILLVLSTF